MIKPYDNAIATHTRNSNGMSELYAEILHNFTNQMLFAEMSDIFFNHICDQLNHCCVEHSGNHIS